MEYSLFLLEESYETEFTPIGSYLTKSCFEYVDTFDTLEQAKLEQKKYKLKTIIIPTY